MAHPVAALLGATSPLVVGYVAWRLAIRLITYVDARNEMER